MSVCSVTANQRGMMLAPVMGILAIIASLALSYTALTLYNHKILLNDKQGEQALFIAEAGIEDALHELKLNSSWRTGFSNKSFASGSYSVSVSSTSWLNVSNALAIQSEGHITQSRAKSVITAIIALGSAMFDSAIQSTQNINMNHDSGTISGDVTTGGNYNANSGSLVVQGTVNLSSTDPIPIPDLTAWQAAATTIVNTNKTFTAGTYSGIWFIQGNVSISSNVTMNGTIVATGNIQFSNTDHITILAGNNKAALVAGGSLSASNSNTLYIEGLIYGSQGISFNNQSACTYIGAVVSLGTINMNNSTNLSIAYDGTYAENPLYFNDSSGSSEMRILAWK